MVSELTIFSGCLFGGVASLAWWASNMLLRDRSERLRERLRGSEWDPRNKLGKQKLGSFVQRVGQSASTPFMPKNKEKMSRLRRQLGYAGIYSPVAINLISGFKLLLLLGGIGAGYAVGLVLGNSLLGFSLGGLIVLRFQRFDVARFIGGAAVTGGPRDAVGRAARSEELVCGCVDG